MVSDIPAGDGKNTNIFYSVPAVPQSIVLYFVCYKKNENRASHNMQKNQR